MSKGAVMWFVVVFLAFQVAAPPAVARATEGELLPGEAYGMGITRPEQVLGFPVGSRAASPEQIRQCLETWAGESPRARLVKYAESHEGRPLFYMIVTSASNLARIDQIKEGMSRLADPRGLEPGEARALTEGLPAVAWLAYSIHGNESSGSDASLALLYHLLASTDQEVAGLLEDLVVIVDPMMNPDGRARFVKQLVEHRGTSPNTDDQSLLHTGYWPWGRMNHYLFDLNRDWILGVNPESRGRIAEAGSWHPLLLVDAHEMGSQDTYLFSPAKGPQNPDMPARNDHWGAIFAREQARAFDSRGWLYYTGEWNEGWYPGYSDAWARLRGAQGILYEQASLDEDGVTRPGGKIMTYREAVHHHLVSSLTNLRTLRSNARALLGEFLEQRREAVSADGPYADRTFAILPTKNRSRLDRLIDLMELQGVEVHVSPEGFTSGPGTDQLGRSFTRRDVPAGTLLIPNRQPEARLVSAMLSFDQPMPEGYLKRERKELLRSGDSTIYDVTAWNITMLYGLPALALDGPLPAATRPYEKPLPDAPAVKEDPGRSALAYVIDGEDDRSVASAARLMEEGLEVRVADRPFELDGLSFSRGSVVVTRTDNDGADTRISESMNGALEGLGVRPVAVNAGLGEGDLPDLGGGHFRRLERPRIAILARGGNSAYDVGSIWHLIDTSLGVPNSHLDENSLAGLDLRRYNVLVLPDRWFGSMPKESLEAIGGWVREGGTLVAMGRSAASLARGEPGLGDVKNLPEVLDKLDDYELAVLREWMAASGEDGTAGDPWSHTVAAQADYPWDGDTDSVRPQADELKRRDQWGSIFMPRGAVIAARTDPEHWLTFGAGGTLPVLVRGTTVLMSAPPVETPVRLGVFEPDPDDDESGPTRVGWSLLPPGQTLRLRMSGLLWPEASPRLSNSAYLTRQPLGNGQIILFSTSPVFRGATLATARLLANALVYGPGLGASHAIEPRPLPGR